MEHGIGNALLHIIQKMMMKQVNVIQIPNPVGHDRLDTQILTCRDEEYVCEKHNLTGCMVDGRSIVNLPNEYCLTGPDNERCAILPGYGCPEGFATMNSANFTISRCVPESAEEVEKAERERQVTES